MSDRQISGNDFSIDHDSISTELVFVWVNGRCIPKARYDKAIDSMTQLIAMLPKFKALMETTAQGLIDLIKALEQDE